MSERASGHAEQGNPKASYLPLLVSGELARRVKAAWAMLSSCHLCPRGCGVDRLAEQAGFCGATGRSVDVASHSVHRWEEPPISGTRGSGTIFFAHCTARCLFCQNYPISQLGVGSTYETTDLAGMMLSLQRQGCHNINLVTPTHYVPHVLDAILRAARSGLHLPIVYNTSGYDSVETLSLLNGIVDIYLPDAKYADDDVAEELSGIHGYVSANHDALREMARQVGPRLLMDDEGIAYRGMVVRHLVLPERLSQTAVVLRWIADEISPQACVSLMAQYFPAHRAVGHPRLGRRLTEDEYEAALDACDAAGIACGWRQEWG